jgi:hypothetical protein
MAIDGGHVSVAIERSESPSDLVEPIRKTLRSQGIGPAVAQRCWSPCELALQLAPQHRGRQVALHQLALERVAVDRDGATSGCYSVPSSSSAPPSVDKRASRSTPTGLSPRTSTKRPGPASSDACSATAKQVSARGRSALSEVVHSGRVDSGTDTLATIRERARGQRAPRPDVTLSFSDSQLRPPRAPKLNRFGLPSAGFGIFCPIPHQGRDHRGTGDPCLIGPRCYGHPAPGEGGM